MSHLKSIRMVPRSLVTAGLTVCAALVLVTVVVPIEVAGHVFPVLGDYAGSMPYPPGVAPAAGALSLPLSSNFNGVNYDCRRFVDHWAVKGREMRGVVLAGDPVTRLVHGFFARSGAWVGNAVNPVVPPRLAGYPDQGPVATWTQAQRSNLDDQNLNEINALSTRVTNLFNAPRKCFGVPTATATCANNPNAAGRARIQRAFTAGGGPENGVEVGMCALTKIIMHMTTRGYAVAPVARGGGARNYGTQRSPIPQSHIICAAEKTGGGWNGGYNVAPGPGLPAAQVNYSINATVHSCATCQQQVPMLFGAECAIAAPVNGARGGCPAQLIHGDTCQVACDYGAPVGAATTCNNGVAAVQTCPPPGMVRQCIQNVCRWVRANPGKAMAIGAAVVTAGVIGAKKLKRTMPNQIQAAADDHQAESDLFDHAKATQHFRHKLQRLPAHTLDALQP